MNNLSFWSLLDDDPIQNKVIKSVTGLSDSKFDDEVVFNFTDGSTFRLYHPQDCCESVYLEDCEGKVSADFEGGTLLEFEKATQDDPSTEGWGSVRQWTFYKIRTTKQDLTLRWIGESNGYYSVEVECEYTP